MRHLENAAAMLVGGALWLGVAAAPATANVAPEGRESDTAYDRGMQKVAAEDYATALDLLEKAVAAEPNNLRFGTDYRQAVIASGEYDRSLEFFEGLVEKHPDQPNLLMNFGYAHVDKIPVEGAITQVILANSALGHFSAALELEETWLGRYTRGNSYLYWPAIFGRTQLGIDDLERAIEMAKADKKRSYQGRAWAALGDGHWRLDDPEKAMATYKKGLELYPDNAELKQRAALSGEELDAFLEALFDTNRRVDTHLREIWEAHRDD